MIERLQDFDEAIEVVTHGDTVVAVLYDGKPLDFSLNEVDSAVGYRAIYENGDQHPVFAVEVVEDE